MQTRACHVFLLEPSLDPAIEQQAVARVHRIGQTRDVTVTRLLMEGSIELQVMAQLKVGMHYKHRVTHTVNVFGLFIVHASL